MEWNTCRSRRDSLIIEDNDIFSIRRAVVLNSGSSADIKNNIIRDCDRGIYSYGDDIFVNIIGNTIKNCRGSDGGGIFLNGTTAHIEDNDIRESWDGAINLYQGSVAEIIDNRMSSNESWDKSPDMNVSASTATIYNTAFSGGLQHHGLNGSGAVEAYNSDLTVINCIFYSNRPSNYDNSGAAIYASNTNFIVKNNIFMKTKNSAQTVLVIGSDTYDFSYNDFWDNDTGADVTGLAPGPGNINKDPLFTNTSSFGLNYLSPCLNAGDPDSQYTDVDGTRNDMGIYGGPYGGLPDSDQDGLTDLEEIEDTFTDPADPDSDDDEALDGEEVHKYLIDPNDEDSDGDSFSDGFEIMAETDPKDENSTPILSMSIDYPDLVEEAYQMTQQVYQAPEIEPIPMLDPSSDDVLESEGLVFLEKESIVTDNLYSDIYGIYAKATPRAFWNKKSFQLYIQDDPQGDYNLKTFADAGVDYSSSQIMPPINPEILPIAGKVLSVFIVGGKQDSSHYPQFFTFDASGYARFNGFIPQTVGASYRIAGHNVFQPGVAEDFPRYRNLFFSPRTSSSSSLMGLVDAEGFTGAFDMILTHGEESTIHVVADFFPRRDIMIEEEPYTGFAAYSSMFYRNEDDTLGDSTDEAHDTDTVVVGWDRDSDSIVDIIRELEVDNPADHRVTDFSDFGISGKQIYFAIENRDRDELHYSANSAAQYHLRDSYAIELISSDIPLSLIFHEDHTDEENYDNVAMVLAAKENLTQADSVNDAVSIEYITRAYYPEDSDADGLMDQLESLIGTNINDADSDDDGINDHEELLAGTDPLGGQTYLPPSIATIGDKSVSEGTGLSFTVSASDPDAGDVLTYSADDLPEGAEFNADTQSFSWTPGYDQAGSYEITFTVTDNHGLSDSETVTVTVSNVNRTPSLGSIGDKSVNEGAALSFSISANDPDAGDVLTYSVGTLPSGAEFDKDTKTFRWTPGYDQAGSYEITFTVTDNHGLSDSETVTITVSNVNRTPSLGSIGDKSVNEGAALSFSISANDPDAGDVLTYSAWTLPDGATFNTNTQMFNWTPGYDQAGSYTVTFKVTDNHGASDSETVTITVSDVPQPPVLTSIADQTVDEWVTLRFTVSATDADAGDVLTYSAESLPSGAVFDLGTKTFNWTPGYDQEGSYAVTFTVTDNHGLSDSETVTITVSNVNRSPVMNLIADQIVEEAHDVNIIVSANDPDAGDVLTYSVGALPDGSTFNTNTQMFSWTPGYDQAGSYSVTFTVTDNHGASDSETMTITVSDVNQAPVMNAITDQTVEEGQEVSFVITATDPDEGDVLTYSADELPSGAEFDPDTQTFAWTPHEGQAGTYTITFTVTDEHSGSDQQTVTFTVVVSGAPIIRVPQDYSTIQEAIDAAIAGDTIMVAAGTYQESLKLKSDITLMGTGGGTATPDDLSDDTIIDGNSSYRGMFISHKDNVTVEGLTIMNGQSQNGANVYISSGTNVVVKNNLIMNGRTDHSGSQGYGAGLYVYKSAALIQDNIFKDNDAWGRGGGIYAYFASPQIIGNHFENNQADGGGAIYQLISGGVIQNNTIKDNFTTCHEGGGIYLSSDSSEIINNTIIGNKAVSACVEAKAGAIYVGYNSTPRIINNIMTDNEGKNYSGGIYCLRSSSTSAEVDYNLLNNNTTVNGAEANYYGCSAGVNSLEEDPQFVDKANGDYHLQSSSPAIDAGNPDETYNDPDGSRNDMGVYGGPRMSL